VVSRLFRGSLRLLLFSATVEPTSQLRIISLRSCRSITFQITGRGKNSRWTATKHLRCMLTRSSLQVPKGYQESAGCTEDATKSRVCFQSDRKRYQTRPGETHSSLRHVQELCETVWVLMVTRFHRFYRILGLGMWISDFPCNLLAVTSTLLYIFCLSLDVWLYTPLTP
jgi:hypothetical protein